METRVEPQEVGRAGKGSPPQRPKASQKRNQLSDSPAPSVPADPFQNERGGLHIWTRGWTAWLPAEQPCPARAAGSKRELAGLGTPRRTLATPLHRSSGDANTQAGLPSVHLY